MNLKGLLYNNKNYDHRNHLPSKYIAFAWLGIFVTTMLAVSPLLAKVFSGEWLVNQNLIQIRTEYLNLFGLINIPFDDIILRAYSIIFLLAVLAAYFLALFMVNKSYLPNTLVDRLLIGLLLIGMGSGRLFYVLFNLEYYLVHPTDIPLIYKGGLSIMGAIIGASLYIYYYARRFRFSFYELCDLLVPSLLIGQIIGRAGNFFNYEAYGGPTSLFWKMYVPEAARNANKYIYEKQLSEYFHPTFLYEILLNAGLLFLILFKYDKWTKRQAGLVMAMYMMGYGLIRTFTEYFRMDALRIDTNWVIRTPQRFIDFMTNINLNADGQIRYALLDPFTQSLIEIEVGYIAASQVVALLMFITGFVVWRRRRDVVYSAENLTDLS